VLRRNLALSLECCDVTFANEKVLFRSATSKLGQQYYAPMKKMASDTFTL
jgi:hypothetical protein